MFKKKYTLKGKDFMKKATVMMVSLVTLMTIFTTSALATELKASQESSLRFTVDLVNDLPQDSKTEKLYGFVNAFYDSSEGETQRLYAAAVYMDGKFYISREVLAKAFPEIEYVVAEETTTFKKGNHSAEVVRYGYLKLDGQNSKEIKVGNGSIRIFHAGTLDELVPLRPIMEHLGYKVKYKSGNELSREEGEIKVYGN